MPPTFQRTFFFLSLSLLLTLPSPPVQPGASNTPIRLDGLLDEAAWQGAGVIDDLTQQSPRPGEPTPFKTRVRFLRDAETLFVGFECVDPEPSRITMHTMQRDGNQSGDDSVAVVLALLEILPGGIPWYPGPQVR